MTRLHIDARKKLGAFESVVKVDLPLRGLTAIFGPSGAGKSTLINLVSGLHRPDSGRISIGSITFFDSSQRIDVPVQRRELGYVFQDARLFPHLNVRNNLLFGFKRAGARATGARVTLHAVVELLGLNKLLEQKPHTLSGGEKQRVALGRALLAQPRLLLMDEPLASLDAARKSEVIPYIERLRDDVGIPILYVSHALDEVLRLSTSLVLLDRGAVVAAGELAHVLAQPAVRDRLGDAAVGTLVFGHVRAHDDAYGLSTIGCNDYELHVPRIDLPIGAALRARIPARDVALSLARPSDVSITNRIEGAVDSITVAAGPYALVSVSVAPNSSILARITRESVDRLALVEGTRVWCLIKSVALDAGALAMARGQAARPLSASGESASMNDERFDVSAQPP
jgi:molybdate transport system ATP-binding protein